LRFDNGLCFEKPKYAHCFLLNSRHFDIWRHIFSQTSKRRVQRCHIKLSELDFTIGKQFYFVAASLKIIGHGNRDNNLESSCISTPVCIAPFQYCSNRGHENERFWTECEEFFPVFSMLIRKRSGTMTSVLQIWRSVVTQWPQTRMFDLRYL
jgi:hypothetical protein